MTERTPQPLRATRPDRRRFLLAVAGAASQLAACGGGGGADGLAGISTGGTGSFTSGPITGFGSIIVNGIRYDDSSARVGRLDGEEVTAPLRLGMIVSVQGSPVSGSIAAGTATATADRILYVSEWLGPVGALNAAAGTFQIIGQTVRTNGATVFEGAGVTRLADLSPGLQAEVYGFVDPATATLQATRVELSAQAPAFHRLSGIVVDRSDNAFSLGSVRIVMGDAGGVGWSEGSLVRVVLATAPDRDGRRIATRITAAGALLSALEIDDDDAAELKGSVTAITGASAFSVNGIPVDTGGLGSVSALGLTLGALVKVEGRIVDGRVIAKSVSLEDSEEDGGDQAFELHGLVEALNLVDRSFVVRGYAVRYDALTRFGLEGAAWADGLRVEVDAALRDGLLRATRISVDD